MGNLRSVAKALEAVGAQVLVSANPADLRKSGAHCASGAGRISRLHRQFAATGSGRRASREVRQKGSFLGIAGDCNCLPM